MFTKILIANRGEIACRVAATARRMGIQTVAVYSDADAGAKHVQACDEAVHVGGAAPKDSYLKWQRIIDAAKATGAEAIHPGYGFLSENADFATACAAAGLVFIGPPATAILAMGLKAESKRLMASAGVPLVPGYHGADQDEALLQREADLIGYPVLIKASAGGGGKGMRLVETSGDFAAALASCKREAINSFGSDAVLIEKYVQQPRHIEIQVFGDTFGNVVHLFERDCSVQRRHQKVIEEAPAPGMTESLRNEMGAAAVAAAKAVNYVGAGTVEFIVEQPQGHDHPEAMRFYFMEMNTRLQVEHPVTEAITGLDLVEWQLCVAAGQPLPLTQAELCIRGHAIEARICAENPEQHFLPATGRLQVYQTPASSAYALGDVRLDDGVREGDAISPYYDSMVGKLIVHGRTRQQALARLDQALAQFHIVGVANNVAFLRRLVRCASFAKARLDTALIPRESGALVGLRDVSLDWAMAAHVASTLLAQRALQTPDPWSHTDGWVSHGEWVRGFELAFGAVGDWPGQVVRATLIYRRGGGLMLDVEGLAAGELVFTAQGRGIDLQWQNRQQRVFIYKNNSYEHVYTQSGAIQFEVIDALAHAGQSHQEGGRLTAPMPGKVISFAVNVGDVVKRGQTLAVMEAMKMEHTLCAPQDGVVSELLYAVGDSIAEGAELLKLKD